LFANDYRFDSHGCTRVDNVRDLAAWILQDVPPWNRAAIDAGIAAGGLKIVNLPHRCRSPGFNLTGWVTRDGTIQFRDDVYKHDQELDRDKLDETVRAGGFVAPLSREAQQAAPPPPEVKQVSTSTALSRRHCQPAVPDIPACAARCCFIGLESAWR